MPAAQKSTRSRSARAKAPTVAELQKQLAAAEAALEVALEVAQQHSDDPASSVKDDVQDPVKAHKASRRAMVATLAAEAGSVVVRDNSLKKAFVVAADPQYSRYVTIMEQPSGRTRRVPTGVLLDVVENPDHYRAIIATSLGRQIEALANVEGDLAENAENVEASAVEA